MIDQSMKPLSSSSAYGIPAPIEILGNIVNDGAAIKAGLEQF